MLIKYRVIPIWRLGIKENRIKIEVKPAKPEIASKLVIFCFLQYYVRK